MNIKRLFIISGSTLLGITFILIWLLFGPPILTRAASYTVCTAGPPTCDYIFIQSAVDKAGDGDVVKVAAGTYTGINNYGGQAQMVFIDKSVTIRGGYTTTNWTTSDPAANPTTLDAQGGGRVLYITGNISPTIEGLRITGGDATVVWSGGSGGGVYIENATANIRNNRVFSNTAGGPGGGLTLLSSDAMIIGNTFSNNTSPNDWGGGISISGDNVTISGNTISNNSADWAGGVDVKGNNVRIVGNIISSNTAVNSGGGGSIDGDIEFIGNSVIANTSGGGGGGLAIHEVSGVQTITSNKFYGNFAPDGGALSLGGGNPILTNNIIVDNHADNKGSAMNITDGVPFSRLLHNTIARNSGGDGSGIYNFGSTITLVNNIIADHTVGIYVNFGASASLETTLWGSGAWENGTDWDGPGTISNTNDLWGNPDFIDPDAGDYHIGPDSAAIDQGVEAGVTNDIDHHPRPYQEPDIGADEYWPPGALKFIYLPVITR